MSLHRKEKIVCPKCNKNGEFILWQSINTTMDPDMKEKVRNGDAFKYTCPNCGEVTYVYYTTLYHQMEDHIMIQLNLGDNVEESIESMKGIHRNADGEIIDIGIKLDDDYQNRHVTDINAFKEKLKIIDLGLNDKYVELMKFFMFAQLEQSGSEMNVKEFLVDSNENNEPIFAVHLVDDRWGTTDFAFGLYYAIKKDFAKYVEEDKEVVIDNEWARNLLMSIK